VLDEWAVGMRFEDAMMWIPSALAVVVIAFVGWLGWSAYADSQRPTVDLKRDDWECTKSEARSHLQPVLVGQVTVLIPMTTTVCVEYARRGG
jgi:hypothetical protein